jgi:WD40 repeat protein
MYAVVSQQVLGTLAGHSASVETVGFCDVLPFAATGSLDGQVIVWDVQVGRPVFFPPFAIRGAACLLTCAAIALQSLSVRQTCKHDAAVAKLKWVPDSSNFYRQVVSACNCVLLAHHV